MPYCRNTEAIFTKMHNLQSATAIFVWQRTSSRSTAMTAPCGVDVNVKASREAFSSLAMSSSTGFSAVGYSISSFEAAADMGQNHVPYDVLHEPGNLKTSICTVPNTIDVAMSSNQVSNTANRSKIDQTGVLTPSGGHALHKLDT